MSIESAKAYLERMKDDEEFRKKVVACKDAKEREKLAKTEGFDFTKGDINVVMSVMDDAELEKASGGMNAAQTAEGTRFGTERISIFDV